MEDVIVRIASIISCKAWNNEGSMLWKSQSRMNGDILKLRYFGLGNSDAKLRGYLRPNHYLGGTLNPNRP